MSNELLIILVITFCISLGISWEILRPFLSDSGDADFQYPTVDRSNSERTGLKQQVIGRLEELEVDFKSGRIKEEVYRSYRAELTEALQKLYEETVVSPGL